MPFRIRRCSPFSLRKSECVYKSFRAHTNFFDYRQCCRRFSVVMWPNFFFSLLLDHVCPSNVCFLFLFLPLIMPLYKRSSMCLICSSDEPKPNARTNKYTSFDTCARTRCNLLRVSCFDKCSPGNATIFHTEQDHFSAHKIRSMRTSSVTTCFQFSAFCLLPQSFARWWWWYDRVYDTARMFIWMTALEMFVCFTKINKFNGKNIELQKQRTDEINFSFDRHQIQWLFSSLCQADRLRWVHSEWIL